MKNILKGLRIAIFGMLFASAIFAGQTTFNFTANTGSQGYGQEVESGPYTWVWSGSNAFASAYLEFADPDTWNGFVYCSANTDGVATGTYYLGTIYYGDDIYVHIG